MENETEQSNEPVETDNETQSNEPETTADVVSKYNVEQKATEFQTQSAPEEPKYESSYDTYEQETKELVNELKSLRTDVSTMKESQATERLSRDIKNAVDEVIKHVEVPGDNPRLMAELYLEKKYREDPNYTKIWDNRYANPKAFSAASKIIASEMAKDFNVQVDPQLLENVRSAKKSQTMNATAPETQTKTQEMMEMSDEDFEKEYRRIKG